MHFHYFIILNLSMWCIICIALIYMYYITIYMVFHPAQVNSKWVFANNNKKIKNERKNTNSQSHIWTEQKPLTKWLMPSALNVMKSIISSKRIKAYADKKKLFQTKITILLQINTINFIIPFFFLQILISILPSRNCLFTGWAAYTRAIVDLHKNSRHDRCHTCVDTSFGRCSA